MKECSLRSVVPETREHIGCSSRDLELKVINFNEKNVIMHERKVSHMNEVQIYDNHSS